MDRTTLKLGGVLLAVVGLSGIVGGHLHGPQPGTLEAVAELGAVWTVSHFAIGLAGVLLVVSALFIAVHFSGTSARAWALVGSGLFILSGMALWAIGALETAGFSALADQAGTAGGEAAFLAVTTVMASMAAGASLLVAAGIAACGIAMLRHEAWPSWMAWTAVGVGVLVLAVNGFGISLPQALALAPFQLLNAWFVLAGFLMFRMAGADAGAAAAAPPVAPPAEDTAELRFG